MNNNRLDRMLAINDVVSERQRQLREEGYSEEHDASHSAGELATAAIAYAACAVEQTLGDEGPFSPSLWPWSAESFKPKGRRENLVRAAALLIAEIERLDRRPV